jgi:hypothetical protein
MTVPLEIKSLEARQFEGYGSTFGNVDHGDDIVMPGAFKRSLAEHRKNNSLLPMLWMHKPDQVAGKWLEMREDEDGLFVKGVLAPTPLGDEIHTLLKMEAVRGLSIGFKTIDQDFDKDGHRLLKELQLWETSIVSMPMNPLAQIAHVKSRLSANGEYVPTKTELEYILRKEGCSRNIAKQLVHKIRLFDEDSTGEIPDESLRNAEDEELAKALQAVADNIMADAIRAKFAKRSG